MLKRAGPSTSMTIRVMLSLTPKRTPITSSTPRCWAVATSGAVANRMTKSARQRTARDRPGERRSRRQVATTVKVQRRSLQAASSARRAWAQVGQRRAGCRFLRATTCSTCSAIDPCDDSSVLTPERRSASGEIAQCVLSSNNLGGATAQRPNWKEDGQALPFPQVPSWLRMPTHVVVDYRIVGASDNDYSHRMARVGS